MTDMVVEAAQITGFFAALWLAGAVLGRCGISALVGEILIGLALGPQGLNVIPEWHGIALIGQVGIFWLMFDGGAHLDIDKLRTVGGRAFLVAATGLVLPLCAAFGTMLALDFSLTEAFVMGTALAPTSGGMALKLMQDACVLQTTMGQTIVAAAMTDDVLSLVILAIVSNLRGVSDAVQPFPPAVMAFLPVATSLCFIVGVYAISRLLMRFLSGCLAQVVGPIMVVWSTGLALACHYSYSSAYLGAFLAGMSLARIQIAAASETVTPMAVSAWLEQDAVAMLQGFFVSVFFASMGFDVPVHALFDRTSAFHGMVCALVAIVGKLLAGVWCPGDRWCIGWAMVARGELGFVMANQALRTGLLSRAAFTVTIWGVLLATVIAPIALKPVLNRKAGLSRPSQSV